MRHQTVDLYNIYRFLISYFISGGFSVIIEALGTKGVFNFRGHISDAEWKIARYVNKIKSVKMNDFYQINIYVFFVISYSFSMSGCIPL